MALLLKENDVKSLLTMEDTLHVLESAFTSWGGGRAMNRPRQRIRVPKGFLHFMPAASLDDRVMGFKAYAVAGGQARFVVMLFDAEQSNVVALFEANHLGQMRTGAASGLAAKYLAHENAATVGIIGTGYQAEAQIEALCTALQIQHVKAFSRKAERREAFATEMPERLKIDITAVESAKEAVQESDIVITVTTARAPVFEGEWLKPGACVLAAGSNHWMRHELDRTAFKRADCIVVDDLEQAKIECGELMAAVEGGAVRWESVLELRGIVSGTVPGRQSSDDIVVFESQGVALEDIAVAAHLLKLAEAQGVGQPLDFG